MNMFFNLSGIQPPATQASTALDRQQSSAAPGAGLTGAPQTLPTQGSWVGPGALLEAGSTEPPGNFCYAKTVWEKGGGGGGGARGVLLGSGGS